MLSNNVECGNFFDKNLGRCAQFFVEFVEWLNRFGQLPDEITTDLKDAPYENRLIDL